MNFLGDSERDRLLGAAFDEACEPYRIGGAVGLTIRPFSLGVFRRALTLEIRAVREGFAAIEGDDLQLVADCEALAWLLSADEDAVREAVRTARWKAGLAAWLATHPLSLRQLSLIRGEVERQLRLIRAAMFGVSKRAALSDAIEKAEEEERASEPPDLLTPGRLTAITLGIYEKTGWSEFFVQERLPLCRLLQYAHGVQWSNPRVWTVDPWGPTLSEAGDDPLAGIEALREPREAVAIEF